MGGNKQDIADTLVNRLPAGCVLNGSQIIDAVDVSGNKKTIKFDFATDKPIFVKVNVKTNDAWNVDSSATDIKEQVAQFISRREMGQTVFLTKLYPIVYDINGVEEATVEIGTSKDNLNDKDIPIEWFEAPSCDVANVEVVING